MHRESGPRVLLLKSIVEYCEMLLNFTQIMPHWILRLGVERVEEDGGVMVKNIYIYELVLNFKQETKHSLSGLWSSVRFFCPPGSACWFLWNLLEVLLEAANQRLVWPQFQHLPYPSPLNKRKIFPNSRQKQCVLSQPLTFHLLWSVFTGWALCIFCDLMADLKENCQFSQEPRAPPFRNLKIRTLSLGQFSICEERGKYIGKEGEKTEGSDRRVM